MQQTVNMVTRVDGGLYGPFTFCVTYLSTVNVMILQRWYGPRFPVARDDAMHTHKNV